MFTIKENQYLAFPPAGKVPLPPDGDCSMTLPSAATIGREKVSRPSSSSSACCAGREEYQPVPSFDSREGDCVWHGENFAAIALHSWSQMHAA